MLRQEGLRLKTNYKCAVKLWKCRILLIPVEGSMLVFMLRLRWKSNEIIHSHGISAQIYQILI